jgi:hypothetical protein
LRIGSGGEIVGCGADQAAGATYAVPPMLEAYATVQPPVPPDGSREWSWNEGLERHDAGGLGFAHGRWVPVRGVTECC